MLSLLSFKKHFSTVEVTVGSGFPESLQMLFDTAQRSSEFYAKINHIKKKIRDKERGLIQVFFELCRFINEPYS